MSGTLDNSTSWAPPGEDAADLWLERAIIDGTSILAVAYGIFFTLFCQCASLLIKDVKRKGFSRWRAVLLAYVVADFILITIFLGGEVKYNEMTFVDDRNFPGGPGVFSFAAFSDNVSMMANAVFILSNWLADGLLLYRFMVVWNFRYWMIIIPGLVYLSSIATSIVLLVLIVRPDSGFWSAKAVQFGVAYWSLSISLNCLITLLIVARLMAARRQLQSSVTGSQGRMYTSVSAMLVESAALYSIWGLVFLVTYARDEAFQELVCPALCPVQGISSTLIILRVTKGQAWAPDRLTSSSSLGEISTFKANESGVTRVPMTPLSSKFDNGVGRQENRKPIILSAPDYDLEHGFDQRIKSAGYS